MRKECKGRFLGASLDEATAAGTRQGRQNVDMQDPASGIDGRLNRPASRSASHKGKQVTELCTSLKAVLHLWQCSSHGTGSTTKQGICSSMRSGFWLFAYSELLCSNVNHKQSAHVVVFEL